MSTDAGFSSSSLWWQRCCRAAEYDRLMGEADKLRGPIIESCGKHASKFKSLQKDIAALAASGAESSSVKEIEEMASRVSSDLCKASKLKPVTGSLFIRLFLGSVNVKVLHEADRRKLKDEHDKFKSRTNLCESFSCKPMGTRPPTRADG